MYDRKALWTAAGLSAVAVLINSTLLDFVAVRGVKPDLALCVVLLVAVRRGSMTGQLAGFCAGLVEDFVSLAPLGFNALIRTALGFLAGRLEGVIFVDGLLVPVALTVAATLLKAGLMQLLALVFALAGPGWGGPVWVEVLYNAAVSPVVFAAAGFLKPLAQRKRTRRDAR